MATLTINNTVINKNLKEVIQHALYGDVMKNYIINKYDWTNEIFSMVNWEAMKSALRDKRGIHKVTVQKLIHFWQPTNKYVQRNQRRKADTAVCTECGEEDTQMHYMRCKSTYFTEARA